jgi:hypothetical protein
VTFLVVGLLAAAHARSTFALGVNSDGYLWEIGDGGSPSAVVDCRARDT